MLPPLFPTCVMSSAVTSLLGESPTRLYPAGEAPQDGPAPYATYQIASGAPFNYLSGRPDTDATTTQVDIYGRTMAEAHDVYEAIRDAVEPVAYVVAFNLDERDEDTRLWRVSFDVDWITPR